MIARRERHHGGVVAATWLIGLGVVFLLQQTLEMPWAEAWPLFIILAGVAALVRVSLGLDLRGRWLSPLAWPVLLLVVGALLLLSTTGRLGIGPGELVERWWPAAVIALGAWLLLAALLPDRTSGTGHLEVPLDGAESARVTVRFGGGELNLGPGRPGMLLDGLFEGLPAKSVVRGPGNVQVEPSAPAGWPWWDRTPSWRIGLPADIPLDLEVESGAARTRLELTETRLRSLRIGTGASETRVSLPRAAGETRVRAESGAASLTFEVPSGVAARIRSKMALGSTRVDEGHFPRSATGWESADYADSANRVEFEISGGVGSVQIIRSA
ncbi:MAG TPA: hypothetical protein VK838_02520 [Candidatus Limnocylindrales bacterium]|nr:hypothetical protein [Candidatus Limnocylindrales bacterium]